MASLVPEFEYDIFISYRQKDNKGDRWVTEFVEALRNELDSTFKENISLYFDENPHDGLSDFHEVDDSLKDKLKCLIFLPILSQTYCDTHSFAFEHELTKFAEMASSDKLGLKVKLTGGNVANRILPVKIHEIDTTDILQFERVTGSRLRSIDFIYKESGVNRPLNHSDSKKENQYKTAYRNQVNKTANAIKEILTALKSPADKEKEPTEALPVRQKGKTSKRRLIWALSGTVAFFLLIYGLIRFTASEKRESGVNSKSIAVLPFGINADDKEQESFSEGILEEIIGHLYSISDIQVVPLASSMRYRDTKLKIDEVARELNIHYILYISVWKSDSRIKITANFVDALKDRQLWSEPYERELTDVFAIQSEVAQMVASRLKVKISDETQKRINSVPTTNTEALTLYLQARALIWNEDYTDRNFKATQLLERALKLDHDFAQAYADLGAIWLFRGMYFGYLNADEVKKKALPYLSHAVSLDPDLVDAHAYLALYFLDYQWDFETAAKEWNKVFELSPSNTFWPSLYTDFLQASGRFKESLEMNSRLLEIDKTNSGNWVAAAGTYSFLGEVDRANQIMKEALEIFPENAELLLQNIIVKIYTERFSDALPNVNTLLTKYRDFRFPRCLGYSAIVYLKTGQKEKVKPLLDELINRSKVNSVGSPSYFIAQVYTALGNKDSAFIWLEKAFTDHEMEMFWLKVEPTLNSLHTDPRWANLLNTMPFPDQNNKQ